MPQILIPNSFLDRDDDEYRRSELRKMVRKMSSNCPNKRTQTAITNKLFDRNCPRARNLSFEYLNMYRKSNRLQDKNMSLKIKITLKLSVIIVKMNTIIKY